MSEVDKQKQESTHTACESCALYNPAHLKKLGVNVDDADFVVALAGNPNTGKSTVFNALTGLRQHTGNWPGKTVTRAEGGFSYNDNTYRLIDLPGTYSLLSTSEDEEVARNFILFGRPDVTVIVVDASRLERNLNLVLQILEITDRAIVCLNLMDETERHGIQIDDRTLAKELGAPVVKTSARSQEGIPELIQTIEDMAAGKIVSRPHKIKNLPVGLEKAVNELSERITRSYPNLPNSRWVAMRLLDGDLEVKNALLNGEFEIA